MDARPAARPWTLVSLRPRGQHAGLRRAAAQHGARLLALSPLQVVACDDAAARAARTAADTADLWLFTSPNAVRAAHALQPLHLHRRQCALGVGAGTRRALARLGLAADAPASMDSEGLLGMPALQDVAGRRIALFTAPGGRDRLAPALQARGAAVTRIDAYARVPAAIPHARWEALRQAMQAPGPVVLALSSGEALLALLAQVPTALGGDVRALPVVAASARLAGIARDAGFARIAIAGNAGPAMLARTARDAFA